MSNFFASNNPTTLPASRLARRTHAAGAALAIAALATANSVLNQLYIASGHPVDYLTGQTSFSGEEVKGWYAEMQAAGTLDVYWYTQLFDFVFILTVFAMGSLAATFLARINGSRRGSGSALWAAAALALGAMFDAAENLISFVMLSNPQGFPNWVAVPYSTMAVIKFTFIGTGVALIVFSVFCWVLHIVGRLAMRSVGRAALT